MTQDLRAAETPPNLPTAAKFWLMCVVCGVRSERVKFSSRIFANICQPNCEVNK